MSESHCHKSGLLTLGKTSSPVRSIEVEALAPDVAAILAFFEPSPFGRDGNLSGSSIGEFLLDATWAKIVSFNQNAKGGELALSSTGQ
jgi:hypothetical protein